ncbi:Argonaute siRNA chaperone complex subunit Arb1-domain-containing protein [Macrophomina phaseolina]|uniref:Argonaute siRNA chaperone complex subunit Arb1-domain-containing protein n=1 Tax=Macrophomina phaseolina TaxID=35725 RepID=A0ABQ8GVE4_9PEZI|nr:Argonaute siRNA chaperone complex subunit Arb1-domain-containing protein [Macrophomina phaseolina]
MSEPAHKPSAVAPLLPQQRVEEATAITQTETPHPIAGDDLPKGAEESSSTADHPSGPEIRRQVEYYFSDENLPTDHHLLEKCQGRLNLPVSIKSICCFKKMRQYKPYPQVVEALKKSAFLDVVDGGMIKRKVPFMGKTVLDEYSDDSDDNFGADEEPAIRPPQAKKTKKQPVQQPQMRKPSDFNRPHGFEEFFADAPVTPAEFREEVSIYDPGISFRLRIECAIQRYKSRRKMHEHFLNAFSKFMKYGGVDQSQRQFTGDIRDKELEERDAQDIALMMANHTIDPDKDEEGKWSVAFEEVAKGFLSSYWPTVVFYDMQDIRLALKVLMNFYNYLLHHNVCPEYKDDILAARKVCTLAESEFPKVAATSANLPGDFNVACSTLFNGFYKDKCVIMGGWDDVEQSGVRGKFAEHTKEKSSIIFKTAIGAHGTEKQVKILEEVFEDIICTHTIESTGIEVTAVEMPSAEVLELYAAINAQTKSRLDLKPLGKLHCKHWDIPDFGSYDLPQWYAKQKREEKERKYEFWVEADILQSCFMGMKMQASIRTLSIGIHCLDEIQEIYCSFYTFLANELMWGWKEPNFKVHLHDEPREKQADGNDDSDIE